MKGFKVLILLVVAAILFTTSLALAISTEGSVIPDFTVVSTDGESITLSECLKEYKAVLLNFWYIGCGWCEYEFPFLEEYYSENKDNVLVLALDPYDNEASIAKYKSTMELSFPMAADASVISYFDISGFPTSVIIDSSGVCRKIEVGAQSSKEDFEKLLSPYLDESVNETPTPDTLSVSYKIKFVDQTGAPVGNVTAQIYDANDGRYELQAASDGILMFSAPVYNYELHVTGVPAGYDYDDRIVLLLDKGSGEYLFEVTKLQDGASALPKSSPSPVPSATILPDVPDNESKAKTLSYVIFAVALAALIIICILVFRKLTKK